MSDVSLMTELGILEGELLTQLEAHGSTPIRRLIRESAWPMPMVMMALGGLARAGVVRLMRHDLETIVEPVKSCALAEVRGG